MYQVLSIKGLLILLLTTFYLLLTAPSFAQTTDQSTKEERAVYNINKTLPDEVVQRQKDIKNQDLLSSLLSTASDFISSFTNLFISAPKNRPEFFVQSDSRQNANLPPEVQPKQETSVVDQIKGFLGQKTGYYGSTIPPLENADDVKTYEKIYEQANFPPGIHPILPK